MTSTSLEILRRVALMAAILGGLGSLGFMIRAGRNAPRVLLALFFIWVLSPFAALAWANLASKRWPVTTRATLYLVTLVLSLASMVFYSWLVSVTLNQPPAFTFVAVPGASWALGVVVVGVA